MYFSITCCRSKSRNSYWFCHKEKKRGVMIRSISELGEISRLLSNPIVAQLAKSIDEVNPSLVLQIVGVTFSKFDIFLYSALSAISSVYYNDTATSNSSIVH